MLRRVYFPRGEDEERERLERKGGGERHPRNKKAWERAYACYVEECTAFGDVSAFFIRFGSTLIEQDGMDG